MPFKLFKRLVHKVDTIAALKASAIIFLFIGISLVVSRAIGREVLQARVEQAGIRGPIILVIRKALSVIFVPFSSSITYIVAGGLYGVWKAALLGAIGNTAGISAAFWIGRKKGIKAITWLVGKTNIGEVKHLIGHLTNIKTFTITRLILFPLEDLINFAAGMSKIKYAHFLVISIIIITAFSLVPIFFGHILI